jgi:hypothetical protein
MVGYKGGVLHNYLKDANKLGRIFMHIIPNKNRADIKNMWVGECAQEYAEDLSCHIHTV